MPKNLQCLFGFLESGKKQHDFDEKKEKMQKKTTFENDTIPESVKIK